MLRAEARLVRAGLAKPRTQQDVTVLGDFLADYIAGRGDLKGRDSRNLARGPWPAAGGARAAGSELARNLHPALSGHGRGGRPAGLTINESVRLRIEPRL